MQDSRDGAVYPMDDALIEQQKKMLMNMPGMSLANARSGAIVAAGEAKGIPEKYQGPVFVMGEELDIRGGRFKVARFKHGKMLLEGLPKK